MSSSHIAINKVHILLSINSKSLFYIVVSIGLLAILFTTPFLRYPYDMIHHLIVMDDIYMQLVNPVEKAVGIFANDIYIMIPTGEYEPIELSRPRYLWHYIWSNFFYLLHIDSTEMFLRAKIIHVVQIYISLFSLYYFSKVVIRNIFTDIESIILKWLSLWSVIIWITIFATFSAAYHQVWTMWYSVNYQITLPLFWYITALTLVLFLEEPHIKKKIFFLIQILLFSRFMLQVHSMEFMYYLMYLAVFGLVFLDKIYLLLKRYFYIIVPVIIIIVYMAKHYQPEKSLIFKYLSLEKLPLLYEIIMQQGLLLINGYNRALGSVNELMYVIGIISIGLLGHIIWQTIKNKSIHINTRMLVFILLTSLFVLIPLYQFTGGLFGVITSTMVVNRLYYSSSLFVLLPIISYYFIFRYRQNIFLTHMIILVIVLGTYVYSKYVDTVNHNYYKNIQSIKNSFIEKKVGFNLSQEQIVLIGEQIKQYEQNNIKDTDIRYYARADVAFVIKYIYHKDVYWEGRSRSPDYTKKYEENKLNKDYHQVLFEIPDDFPIYNPYM